MQIKQINIKLESSNIFKIQIENANVAVYKVFDQILKNRNCISRIYTKSDLDTVAPHVDKLETGFYTYEIYASDDKSLTLEICNQQSEVYLELGLSSSIENFKNSISFNITGINQEIYEIGIEDLITLIRCTYTDEETNEDTKLYTTLYKEKNTSDNYNIAFHELVYMSFKSGAFLETKLLFIKLISEKV